jgi:hypothetical protein
LAAIAVAAALLAAGCGSDDDGGSGDGRESGDVSGPSQATTTTTGAGGNATTTTGSGGNAGTTTGPSGIRARSCPPGGEIAALRTVGEDCGTAQAVAAGWSRRSDCSGPEGASRFACSVSGYRCLGTTAGRGISVSCARPGRSVSFIAEAR